MLLGLFTIAPAFAQQGTLEGTSQIAVEGGTLSFQTYFYSSGCGPGAYFNQTTYTNFSFQIGGTPYPISGQQVVAQGYGSNSCPNYTQPSSLPLSLPNTNNSSVSAGNCVFNFSNGNGSPYCPTLSTGIVGPAYQVVSILYAPPGNESTEGLVNGVTGGTTTTFGSNFTYAQDMSFTLGIPGFLTSGGTLGFTSNSGTSTTTSNSIEFVNTWTNATGIFNDNYGSLDTGNSDAINHTRDDISVWLNPQLTIVTNEDTNQQISYQVSSKPAQGTSTSYADVITVPVEYMIPNASGTTTVPLSNLYQQQVSGTSAVLPGLAAICKNLIASEYNGYSCTPTDQCGCTPADFAQIVAQDALLNYNTSNYTYSALPGNESPISVDASGLNTCSQNPIPTYPAVNTFPDCRYVVIPITSGSSSPELLTLSGSTESTQTSTVTDSTVLTLGASQSYTTGIAFTAGSAIIGEKVQDQWTWQNTQTTGRANGQFNQTDVTLKTKTAGCLESVALYEDTYYHTIVFQTPTDSAATGCQP